MAKSILQQIKALELGELLRLYYAADLKAKNDVLQNFRLAHDGANPTDEEAHETLNPECCELTAQILRDNLEKLNIFKSINLLKQYSECRDAIRDLGSNLHFEDGGEADFRLTAGIACIQSALLDLLSEPLIAVLPRYKEDIQNQINFFQTKAAHYKNVGRLNKHKAVLSLANGLQQSLDNFSQATMPKPGHDPYGAAFAKNLEKFQSECYGLMEQAKDKLKGQSWTSLFKNLTAIIFFPLRGVYCLATRNSFWFKPESAHLLNATSNIVQASATAKTTASANAKASIEKDDRPSAVSNDVLLTTPDEGIPKSPSKT